MIYSSLAIASMIFAPIQETKVNSTKISFKTGSKSIVLKGRIKLGQEKAYSLIISAPMKIKVTLKDGKKNGLVSSWHVAYPNGDTYGNGKGWDQFDGKLPAKGEYTFYVGVNQMASNAKSGSYTLTITKG